MKTHLLKVSFMLLCSKYFAVDRKNFVVDSFFVLKYRFYVLCMQNVLISKRRQIMMYEKIIESIFFYFFLQHFFCLLERMKTLVGFARNTEASCLAFTNSLSNIVNEYINGNRLCRQLRR